MHVLITANAAWNIWNFRRPLVEALLKDGSRVTVVAPEDASVPDIERLGCRFVPLDMNAMSIRPLEGVHLLRQFRSLFRQQRPDVVLSFTIKNNIFGAMAARRLGIPFIPNVTGLGTAFLSGGLMQAIAVFLYRRAFGALPIVFFQNDDDRQLFLDKRIIGHGQGRVIPGSGIDLERFAPVAMPPNSAPVIFLMIARLLRDKGVYEFVAAARLIKARYADTRFQLLGAVASANRTAIDKRTIDAWESEGVVEYLGTTDDVRPAIAASHCVVLPSYREGAPRTLIEAAAMARPLIATDVPGCRGVVDPGVSGFLCEARSANSLAAAINQFLALSHAARSEMGRQGRAKMERDFDEALVLRAYRSAIATITASGTASG